MLINMNLANDASHSPFLHPQQCMFLSFRPYLSMRRLSTAFQETNPELLPIIQYKWFNQLKASKFKLYSSTPILARTFHFMCGNKSIDFLASIAKINPGLLLIKYLGVQQYAPTIIIVSVSAFRGMSLCALHIYSKLYNTVIYKLIH